MNGTVAVVTWNSTVDGTPLTARNTDAQYDWIVDTLGRNNTPHTIYIYRLRQDGSYGTDTLLHVIG